ncbi:MAG: zinc-ribbon domain-containing protein [Ruminococcaceae bacterium]|nr:zinc-ribbon domain-containing protein [Oscillospiraceae bacterium]
MFCMKCGNQLQEGALYCEKCGTKMNTAGMPGGQQTVSQYTAAQNSKPIKGIVFNVISFLITIVGILISMFSPYFKVSIKYIDGFLGTDRYTSAKISLFGVGDFVAAVDKYLDENTANSVSGLRVIFWVCMIDIIVAAILLIIRFTKSDGNRYNTFSSYVPLTPIIMTVFGVFSIQNDYLDATMSSSMYLLILLFIANLVIRKLGINFNDYEIDRLKQRYIHSHGTPPPPPVSGVWICESCGWKNSGTDLRCRNCNTPK